MSPSNFHQSNRQLFNISDLAAYKPPPARHIISDGVLDVGTRLMIFGDEGTWKSALAIHAAYAIARGTRWLGFYTSPANVFYIQGEMNVTQTQIRIIKYCNGSKSIYMNSPDARESISNNLCFPTNVIMQAIDFLHLDEQAGIASVRKTLELMVTELPPLPIVLIVDPLYKMFRHELVKATDAKYFADNIDLILHDERMFQYHPGMAVIIVHHSHKPSFDTDGNRIDTGSSDMYGAALFKWWPDTILSCTLDEEHDETLASVVMKFTKHSRIAELPLPRKIGVRWNRSTLHPQILYRSAPKYPEDELEGRGDGYLSELE